LVLVYIWFLLKLDNMQDYTKVINVNLWRHIRLNHYILNLWS